MERIAPTTPDAYNYATFDMAREEPAFESFKHALHVGQKAPDFPLEDLATGETVRLRSLCKQGPVLIEFGSFT